MSKSQCGCFPKLSGPSPETKNLNVRVLGAFLADPTGPKYDESVPNFEYIPRFCHFDVEHMKKVRRIAGDMARKPVSDLIRVLSCLKNTYPSSVYIDYLARVALFKHPDTRFLTLPPPYQTVPSLFFNLEQRHGRLEEIILQGDPLRIAKLDPEQKLAWWREDPGYSSHHGNWHLYYPFDEPPVFERQGELFAYMHEQMLARFDFERLAMGYSRVEAFGPSFGWDKPIKYGYNPRLVGFSPRPANMPIPDIITNGGREVLTIDIVRQTHELLNGISKGYLINNLGRRVPVTMNALGLCLEASTTMSVNHLLYGDIHNNGHVIIAFVTDPTGVLDINKGAMLESFTAARDPMFYRWHKFIDLFFEQHRRKLTPYTLKDWTVLRNLEINSFSTVISDQDIYNLSLPARLETTNHLYNYMGREDLTIYDPEPKQITNFGIKKSVPFSFKLNVRNTGRSDVRAVFRVFVVPETEEPFDVWRLLAVELDRFVVPIRAGQSREIVRSDKDSSVVLPPELTVGHILQGQVESKPPCGCGWPRNLLIPRGREAGMRTKIIVLATDWAEDGVEPDEGLFGSIAYCGKLGKPYPDKRPMGFPFDRNTTWSEVRNQSGRVYMPSFEEAIINQAPNAAVANVTITYLAEFNEPNGGDNVSAEKEFFRENSKITDNEKNLSYVLDSNESSSEDEPNIVRKSLSSLRFFYG